jgi:hypothetical protein
MCKVCHAPNYLVGLRSLSLLLPSPRPLISECPTLGLYTTIFPPMINTHTQIYSFCNWHLTSNLFIKKLFEAGIRSHQRLARSQTWMQGKFALTWQAVWSVRSIGFNLWNWWKNSSSNKGYLATCGVHNSRSSIFKSGLVFWLDVHKICTSNHWKSLRERLHSKCWTQPFCYPLCDVAIVVIFHKWI